MKPMYKGLLLAGIHLAIVGSLGAKLLYDRAYRPRVWVKSAVYDPDLPIRGKYLALTIEVPAEGFQSQIQPCTYCGAEKTIEAFRPNRGDLVLRGDHLVAVGSENGEFWVTLRHRGDDLVADINGETAYFLPEHRNGPILRSRDEELWIEATVPRKGPPRPIRLAIKKNGIMTPVQ